MDGTRPKVDANLRALRQRIWTISNDRAQYTHEPSFAFLAPARAQGPAGYVAQRDDIVRLP